MYLQHWHGWCHMKLLSSGRVLCTPYNYAPCHFMQSHIRKVHACLAVTCHLHFWQDDQNSLRTTAVARGGTDTKIRVSTESWPWRRKFSRRSCKDSSPRSFNRESGALTTELSPLPRFIVILRSDVLHAQKLRFPVLRVQMFALNIVLLKPVLLSSAFQISTCVSFSFFFVCFCQSYSKRSKSDRRHRQCLLVV